MHRVMSNDAKERMSCENDSTRKPIGLLESLGAVFNKKSFVDWC